jgi:hypothetical protein
MSFSVASVPKSSTDILLQPLTSWFVMPYPFCHVLVLTTLFGFDK